MLLVLIFVDFITRDVKSVKIKLSDIRINEFNAKMLNLYKKDIKIIILERMISKLLF